MPTRQAQAAMVAAINPQFASLHSSAPGDSGAAELAGFVRVACGALTALSGADFGELGNTSPMRITLPAGSSASHIGFWSAQTGGTFLHSMPIKGGPVQAPAFGPIDIVIPADAIRLHAKASASSTLSLPAPAAASYTQGTAATQRLRPTGAARDSAAIAPSSALPAGITVTRSGRLIYDGAGPVVGSTSVAFAAAAGAANAASQAVAITIQGGAGGGAANAPIWAHTWAGFASGNAYTASLKALSTESAADGLSLDPITFSLVGGTLPATVAMQSGVNWCNLVYTPSGSSDVGTTTVTIRATNSSGYSDATVKIRIWQAQSGIRLLESPATVYSSIEAAANAMQQGGTILVAPGTYIGACTIQQGGSAFGSPWINDVNVVSAIPGSKYTMDLGGGSPSLNGAVIERRGGAGGQFTLVDAEWIGRQDIQAAWWVNPYLDSSQDVKVVTIRCRSVNCNNAVESPNKPFTVVADGVEVIGAGYTQAAQTHSIYLGAGRAAYCWGLWHHQMGLSAFTAPTMGHLIKSRMARTYLFGCRFTQESQVGPGATPSFIMDFPWGGDVFIAGVIGEKIATTDNQYTTVAYGAELSSIPAVYSVNRFRMYQSTLINRGVINDPQIDIAYANFTARGAPLPTVDIRGNVYSGLGLAGDSNNINVSLSAFIDQANFDFRLITPQGATVRFASWEYAHPAGAVPSGHSQTGHSSYSTAPAWYTAIDAPAGGGIGGVYAFPGSSWSASSVRASRAALYAAAPPNALKGGVDGVWDYSGFVLYKYGHAFGSNPTTYPVMATTIGGGHAATVDNGIAGFVMDAAPSWRSLYEPELPPVKMPEESESGFTWGTVLPADRSNRRGVDSRPRTRHVYSLGNVLYSSTHPQGRFVLTCAEGTNLQPSRTYPDSDLLPLGGSTATWTTLPDLPGFPLVAGVDGPFTTSLFAQNGFAVVSQTQQVIFVRPVMNSYDWSYRYKLDLSAAPTWTTGTPNGPIAPLPAGAGIVGGLLESKQLTALTCRGGGIEAWNCSPDNWNSPTYTPTLTGDTAAMTLSGSELVSMTVDQTLGCFWWWRSGDRLALFKITPPASPATQPWTVERKVRAGSGTFADPTTEYNTNSNYGPSGDGYAMWSKMQMVDRADMRGIAIATLPNQPLIFFRV